MKVKDFQDFGITNITAQQVRDTNAPLDSVCVFLIRKLDTSISSIAKIGCTLVLLPNGLTTGSHRVTWHMRGLAADVAIDGPRVSIVKIIKQLLHDGWTGIGVYHNGQSYRLHLDLRPQLALWGGIKNGSSDMLYYNLIRDPGDPVVREWVTSHSGDQQQHVRPLRKVEISSPPTVPAK